MRRVPQEHIDAILSSWSGQLDLRVQNRRPNRVFRSTVAQGFLHRVQRPGSGPLYELTDKGREHVAGLDAIEEQELADAAAQAKRQEAAD